MPEINFDLACSGPSRILSWPKVETCAMNEILAHGTKIEEIILLSFKATQKWVFELLVFINKKKKENADGNDNEEKKGCLKMKN